MKSLKKILWIVIRVVVSAGLIVFLCTKINFSDRVQRLDGTFEYGKIVSESGDNVVFRGKDGVERVIPAAELKRTPAGTFGEDGLFTIMRKLDKRIFIPCFFIPLIPILIDTERWRILMRVQGINISYWRALQLSWIGLFFNNIMLGSTGGDIIKAVIVARKTDKKAGAVVSVFADRLIGLVALACIAAVVLAFNFGRNEFRNPTILVYGFLCAGLVFTGLYFNRHVRASGPFAFVKKVMPFKNVLREADISVHAYSRAYWPVTAAFMISAHLSGLFMTICYANSLSITEARAIHFLSFLPVISIIQAMPISIGGIGVGESAFVYFFGTVGVPATTAMTLAVLGRLTYILWNVPGALMLIFVGDKVKTSEIEKEEKTIEEGVDRQ
jgi:uncharacterized protein (TIRG00374 family)